MEEKNSPTGADSRNQQTFGCACRRGPSAMTDHDFSLLQDF